MVTLAPFQNLISRKFVSTVLLAVLNQTQNIQKRWKQNPVFLCKTSDRETDKNGNKRKTFKEVLLEVIEIKNHLMQRVKLTLIYR